MGISAANDLIVYFFSLAFCLGFIDSAVQRTVGTLKKNFFFTFFSTCSHSAI